MNSRILPERKAVKAALQSTGLSARQIDALLRGGWAALVGEAEAEVSELRDKLADLRDLLKLSADQVL
jgi:hypothetical protein